MPVFVSVHPSGHLRKFFYSFGGIQYVGRPVKSHSGARGSIHLGSLWGENF